MHGIMPSLLIENIARKLFFDESVPKLCTKIFTVLRNFFIIIFVLLVFDLKFEAAKPKKRPGL